MDKQKVAHPQLGNKKERTVDVSYNMDKIWKPKLNHTQKPIYWMIPFMQNTQNG